MPYPIFSDFHGVNEKRISRYHLKSPCVFHKIIIKSSQTHQTRQSQTSDFQQIYCALGLLVCMSTVPADQNSFVSISLSPHSYTRWEREMSLDQLFRLVKKKAGSVTRSLCPASDVRGKPRAICWFFTQAQIEMNHLLYFTILYDTNKLFVLKNFFFSHKALFDY